MRNLVAKECIDLRYAAIDGPLECEEAIFEATSPESLIVRGATINRNVSLKRASVSGAVNAGALTVHGALDCTDMTIGGTAWVEGEIDPFGEPRGRGIGAARVAFILDYARVDGSVRMNGSSSRNSFTAGGLVRMFGSHMGALNCDGAKIDSVDGICLNLERAVIANGAHLRHGFAANGMIRLHAAEIGDALEMDGATLSAPRGCALNATRVHVAGPVMLRGGFNADGCVRFVNATIGSFVDCSKATFRKANSPSESSWPDDPPVGDVALSFRGTSIGGNLEMNCGFEAVGCVVLSGTRIKESLILGGRSPARIENDRLAVNAFNLVVDQAIVIRNVKVHGILDMRQASCTVLEDEIASWPPLEMGSKAASPRSGRVRKILHGRRRAFPRTRSRKIGSYRSGVLLAGLTYDVLLSPDFGWNRRRAIFKKTIDWTSPQPYLQLAKVYERAGSAATARKVHVARLNAAYRPLMPSRWVLQPLIGYGYRPLRAALCLTAIAIIGGFVFGRAAHENLLTPTHAPTGQTVLSSRCQPQIYPCVHPYAYSVDSLLPVLNLQERSFWSPNVTRAPWVGYLAWSFNGIGWIVGLLVIAGFTNLVRKE
jgi:hypothetical protein